MGEYEEAIEAVENCLEISKKKLPGETLIIGEEAELLRNELRELLKNEKNF